ncbi:MULTISPECIES: hypothetical protein [Pseudoalteromonas]|jgi:hypothetical protein|uniref:hypothetical protein n=1 Tax=Pseudoalteromonas TaxID=53246 RepID=UPI000465E8F6|nr:MULTISPECIES: hypothetical protein [unclassified Pseudoalteromonas]MCK8128163.1 hypothetical protein [Pseudoalteromonas sp. 2CM39R]|tara:strand:- start:418 stop:741 length:324 start_codon:yes stop_codon:yes gene_type:complete
MSLNRVTSSQVKDSETRAYCNELVSLIADSEDWDIEQALNIHNKLDIHISSSLSREKTHYSATELEFLINLIEQLSVKIDNQKQLLAVKIVGNQKNKKAVNKYKSNI